MNKIKIHCPACSLAWSHAPTCKDQSRSACPQVAHLQDNSPTIPSHHTTLVPSPCDYCHSHPTLPHGHLTFQKFGLQKQRMGPHLRAHLIP